MPDHTAGPGVIVVRGVDGFKALAGAVLPPSPWLALTQERVDEFARVTEDVQWIHTDPVLAAQSDFGSTVAHGMLTLSLLAYFWHEVARVDGFRMAVNYGLDQVRFPAPVIVPSRLRGRFAIAEVSEVAGGVHVRLHASVEREGEVKPVCVAELLVRHYI